MARDPAPDAVVIARLRQPAQRRGARVPSAQRERLIVDEAIRFFAREGFDGQMRRLAERLGIHHSVLFRHFPHKKDLVARVYQELYFSRWQPEWSEQLRDRSLPLPQRLLRFYRSYTRAIFREDWVRIFMFAGLNGMPLNAAYLAVLREHLLVPICQELRLSAGLAESGAHAITPQELEIAWGLHGRIFYLAVRKFIYGLTIPRDLDPYLIDAIEVFFHGAMAGGGVPARDACAQVPCEDAAQTAPPAGPPRRRLSAEDRERLIVDEAISYFAEHGTGGQLRALARRIGVTHPLLYRYFPTRSALLERVYQEIYIGHWNPRWGALLRDDTRHAQARIIGFYVEYMRVIFDYRWCRIFIYSSLHGSDISRRYLAIVRRDVILPIAACLRCAHATPDRLSPRRAQELAWGLHGQIFYVAMRRFVYDMAVGEPLDRLVETTVIGFLRGAVPALHHAIGGDGRALSLNEGAG